MEHAEYLVPALGGQSLSHPVQKRGVVEVAVDVGQVQGVRDQPHGPWGTEGAVVVEQHVHQQVPALNEHTIMLNNLKINA